MTKTNRSIRYYIEPASCLVAASLLLACSDKSLGLMRRGDLLTPDAGEVKGAAGGPIDAPEAMRIGMINRSVPLENLHEEAETWVKRFAAGPGQAYAMIKCALNRWPATLESLLELEATMQAVGFSSEDLDEGRKAFLEKRKPVFKGK